MSKALHITSEIGDLKTVVLHRPGKEVENLTPKYLDRLLFDDIPYLPAIQKEHDYFADMLRSRGVDVLYLESLIVESLNTDQIKLKFLDQVLQESSQNINGSYEALKEYLLSFPIKEMVRKVMEGVLKKELPLEKKVYLDDFMTDSYPFYLDPLPNLYFTRDPAAVIQNGISINSMMEGARKRESMFMEYVIKHHPQFKDKEIPIWSSRNSHFPIEGGDILILNKETVAIGVSARTTAKGIEKLALNLFNEDSGIKKVVAVEIPKMRAFMHLDTVFTMIDYDKFTIHPAIQGPKGEMNIFILEKSERQDRLKITRKTNLLESLKEVLCLDEIELIPCGGGDIIASAREQWNDGSNTLAVAPGVVVTYDRNYVSNELLRRHGVEVIEVKSSELARGRGGPRCMSMPLVRGDI